MILVCGKSGSGKSYFCDVVTRLNKDMKRVVCHTTRPKRDGEVDGIDYHFVVKEVFQYKISNDEFVEFKEFNGWYYGISKKEWKTSTMCVSTPSGIRDLKNDQRINDAVIVYLDIDKDIRKQRLKSRLDSADNIERRAVADKEDFKQLDENRANFKPDLVVRDHLFDPMLVLEQAVYVLNKEKKHVTG